MTAAPDASRVESQPGRARGSGGNPHNGAVVRDITDNNGVRPDTGTPAHSYRAHDLGSGPHVDPVLDLRTVEVACSKTERRPREEDDVASDLGDPVDYHLAVGEVQTPSDDNGVSDTHLAERHRTEVAQARHYGYSAPQGGHSTPIKQLGEEGVTDPGEPHSLGQEFRARQVRSALAPILERCMDISGDRGLQGGTVSVALFHPHAPCPPPRVNSSHRLGLRLASFE